MKRRRSAYELPFLRVEMGEDEKRKAIEWWQSGEEFHPLKCPVCGAILALAPRGVHMVCPTNWCSYGTGEIPWAVFSAWERHRSGSA